MARFNALKLTYDKRTLCRELLVRLLTRLESVDETREISWDIFSNPEVVMIVRRIEVAMLLLAGESQREIKKRLGASKSLISRVASRLSRGGRGYEAAAKRLPVIQDELAEEARRAMERQDGMSDESFKQRYWMHYWPELLGRDLPKIARDISASHKRKKSLKKYSKA